MRTEKELGRLLPNAKWNFDLEDCDNILRIENKADISKVLGTAMQKLGILIEELPD